MDFSHTYVLAGTADMTDLIARLEALCRVLERQNPCTFQVKGPYDDGRGALSVSWRDTQTGAVEIDLHQNPEVPVRSVSVSAGAEENARLLASVVARALPVLSLAELQAGCAAEVFTRGALLRLAIGQLGIPDAGEDPDTTRIFAAALRDPRPDVAREAAVGAVFLGWPALRAEVTAAAEAHPLEEVRRSMAAALARWPTP